MEEDFEHIGERLRRAREARGLSVDDVLHRAHLPRSVVEALEAENFTVFTSPTYAKSFLAQYGNFLDVDARPWLDALEPASFISGEMVRPLIATGGSAVEPAPREASRGNGLSTLWILAVSGALVWASVWSYRFFEERFSEPLANERQAEVMPERARPKPEVSAPPAVETTKPEGVASEKPTTPRAIIVRD